MPENIHVALKAMAKANRRCLQEEIKHILEQEVKLIRVSPMEKAGTWRNRLARRDHTDTVTSIREDRRR